MKRAAGIILAATAALWGASLPATAADMVQVSIDQPNVCANGRVLNRISHRFDYQVRNVPNLPQVAIDDFYRISETRHLERRSDRPIDRRYCKASVALSNGAERTVWYLIERPMGFVGFGSNVEFCVSGFDRWHVYGGRCRALW